MYPEPSTILSFLAITSFFNWSKHSNRAWLKFGKIISFADAACYAVMNSDGNKIKVLK
ncbi:MAG: PEP-CTERM sorting domain-containing protein [Gammaproteobacteria bacterium]